MIIRYNLVKFRVINTLYQILVKSLIILTIFLKKILTIFVNIFTRVQEYRNNKRTITEIRKNVFQEASYTITNI